MAADQLGELEAELQSQLEEQRETLATISAALEAEANDELEQVSKNRMKLWCGLPLA